MKKPTLIFIFILLGGLYIFYFILKPFQQPGCGVEDPEPFICGTTNLGLEAQEGRSLFNSTCAACHKLNQDMTGPSLKDMGKSYDTLTIFNYLQGNKSLIESKDFEYTCPNFPHLTIEDVADIMKYTE